MKKKILASQKSEISQHEIAGGAIEQMCDEEGNMTPWEENQPQWACSSKRYIAADPDIARQRLQASGSAPY